MKRIMRETLAYIGRRLQVLQIQPEFAPEETWDLAVIADGVGIVAFTEADELILIEEYSAGPDTTVLTVPKGFVDAGESEAEAASRELIEETGYASGSLRAVGRLWPNPSYERSAMTIFQAKGCRPDRMSSGDEKHEIRVVLVPFEHIENTILNSNVLSGVTLAALMMAIPTTGSSFSVGELFDRYLIVMQKCKCSDKSMRDDLGHHAKDIRRMISSTGANVEDLLKGQQGRRLENIHQMLWDHENEVRSGRGRQDQVLAIYRAITDLNDERAAIKARISSRFLARAMDRKLYES